MNSEVLCLLVQLIKHLDTCLQNYGDYARFHLEVSRELFEDNKRRVLREGELRSKARMLRSFYLYEYIK